MIVLIMLAWSLLGILQLTYINRPIKNWTWGKLGEVIVWGSLGGGFTLIFWLIRFIEADFWKKKISNRP